MHCPRQCQTEFKLLMTSTWRWLTQNCWLLTWLWFGPSGKRRLVGLGYSLPFHLGDLTDRGSAPRVRNESDTLVAHLPATTSLARQKMHFSGSSSVKVRGSGIFAPSLQPLSVEEEARVSFQTIAYLFEQAEIAGQFKHQGHETIV
jgi:hypothetical protein